MSGFDARETVDAAVRRELFGPLTGDLPRGQPLDCSAGKVKFGKREESWGLWHDAASGEEVLTGTEPLKRYGVGVLFGGGSVSRTSVVQTSGDGGTDGDLDVADTMGGTVGISSTEGTLDGPPVAVDSTARTGGWGEADSDDFDLSDANSFKPSAMAISFQVDTAGGDFEIEVTGAHYQRLAVEWPGLRRPRSWWVRRPFTLSGKLAAATLRENTSAIIDVPMRSDGDQRNLPRLQAYSRPVTPVGEAPSLRLVTLALVNQAPGSGSAAAVFQSRFVARPTSGARITPYPSATRDDLDDEEQSLELLYRKHQTFAIGHGCAADWSVAAPDDQRVEASAVWAEPLPSYEVLSLTPDIHYKDADGQRRALTVSMDELARGTVDGDRQVAKVLSLYETWIRTRQQEIPSLPPSLRAAAQRHMSYCQDALQRMRVGWDMAQNDSVARRAFRMANRAMRDQQLRSDFPRREVERSKNGLLSVPGPHPTLRPVKGRGNWRPFQIAFLLASLPELVDRHQPTRPMVDLIFFPTGGGKTEAYLGAAAVSLLARRLRDKDDVGTDTLMRYTLRLLTSQQFVRAAALICVLEDIRSSHEDELGASPFGIGIWLGGTSTPNRWPQAVEAIRQLQRDHTAQNKFLLLRCPWCGAQMGPIPKPKSGQDVVGYQQVGKKVEFRCIDDQCRFGGRRRLPIHVVDSDIYESRPSIVIGTVDKFAMLAWRPEARSIFGLADDGSRDVSPPGLIIQDELHLISGPLGSMVGLYEPVIDALCTDTRHGNEIIPKIIASTATIRRYNEQIRGLFGRGEKQVTLFPPQGLEEGRSFFAEPAADENGVPSPGRRYMGIMSASLGSTQTVQVRVAAATLQAAADIPEEDRDGYWTNLNFLNSLRELGNTVSLIQSDIPDYLTGMRRRDGLESPRWPRVPMELTSRRRNDDIPKAIEQLQVKHGEPGCVDICLASNIIEVGVDIDRLALMTIVGQPKTTAQYIQVSGRVGRRPDRSPGLVLTVYGAAKPRDRSHYERFRSYHQSLYAQVEPTSVTPFARPVLRRALHAAAVSYIRQSSEIDLPVEPFPEREFDDAIELLANRAALAEPEELDSLDRIQRARAEQWRKWDRTEWSANAFDGDSKQGLMRFAGTLPDLSSRAAMWDIPTSMRNVDAECRLEISLDYSLDDSTASEGGDL